MAKVAVPFSKKGLLINVRTSLISSDVVSYRVNRVIRTNFIIHLFINNSPGIPGPYYHLLSNFFKNLPTPFSTLSTLSVTLYLPLKLSFRSCPGGGGT